MKGPWSIGDYRAAWGAEFTAEQINSPDFGIAAPCEDSRLDGATYDPNTGYWHSDVIYRAGGDGLVIEQREPWKPTYRWRRQPIKRLRVEWARWKARKIS